MGCTAEVEHVRQIVKEGTSADRQRRVYTEAIAKGAEADEALKAVVDMLMEETVA